MFPEWPHRGLPINLKGFPIGNVLTDPTIQCKAYTNYALEYRGVKTQEENGIEHVEEQRMHKGQKVAHVA